MVDVVRVRVAARTLALGTALFALACGGDGTGDNNPKPGGTVTGRYLLRITPAAACSTLPAPSFSLLVEARGADNARGHGIQLESVDAVFFPPQDLEEAIVLEGELKYDSPDVRGALSTTKKGVPSREGFELWVTGIGTGTVMSRPNEPGEIAEGVLAGDLAFGNVPDRDDKGSLGECSSPHHRWSLTLQ